MKLRYIFSVMSVLIFCACSHQPVNENAETSQGRSPAQNDVGNGISTFLKSNAPQAPLSQRIDSQASWVSQDVAVLFNDARNESYVNYSAHCAIILIYNENQQGSGSPFKEIAIFKNRKLVLVPVKGVNKLDPITYFASRKRANDTVDTYLVQPTYEKYVPQHSAHAWMANDNSTPAYSEDDKATELCKDAMRAR